MIPVSLVTVHHEGAGAPSDVTRGAAGGYSIWIGASRYTVLRPPWLSFATLDFNHVSLDICLSGNRMDHPVTDADIELIRKAVTEARRNGWVIDTPQVRAHKNSPGSSTVCPGDLAMARWPDIVAACRRAKAPTPVPEEQMASYPSRTKKANRFRGAIVDLANKHVTLANGAECNPAPVIDNPNPWLTSYPTGPGEFVVVTANDYNEYAFDLP